MVCWVSRSHSLSLFLSFSLSLFLFSLSRALCGSPSSRLRLEGLGSSSNPDGTHQRKPRAIQPARVSRAVPDTFARRIQFELGSSGPKWLDICFVCQVMLGTYFGWFAWHVDIGSGLRNGESPLHRDESFLDCSHSVLKYRFRRNWLMKLDGSGFVRRIGFPVQKVPVFAADQVYTLNLTI